VSTGKDKNKKAVASDVKCNSDIKSLAKISRELATAQETIKAQGRQLKAQARQLAAAAEKTDRRSVSLSAASSSLLAKNGIDVSSISASGDNKLTVAEIDACMDKANISVNQRIALKGELTRAGIMEEGHVRRS